MSRLNRLMPVIYSPDTGDILTGGGFGPVVDEEQMSACLTVERVGYSIIGRFDKVPPFTHLIRVHGDNSWKWLLAEIVTDFPPLEPDPEPSDGTETGQG